MGFPSNRMIRGWEASEIRRMPLGENPGCGEVAMRVGTGRAVCRECGRKIMKGEEEFVTVYDFGGGGIAGDPWTGVEIHIHRVECCKVGSHDRRVAR